MLIYPFYLSSRGRLNMQVSVSGLQWSSIFPGVTVVLYLSRGYSDPLSFHGLQWSSIFPGVTVVLYLSRGYSGSLFFQGLQWSPIFPGVT